MKKSIFYIACLAAIFVASCQEKEEPIPTNLIGTWEITGFDSNLELETVNRYTFRPDGTFSQEAAYRESGANEDIGYQRVENGTFRTTSDQLNFLTNETFVSLLSNPPFGSREEMGLLDGTGQQRNVRFNISEDKSEFTIFADDPQGQALDQVYTRI